MIPTAFPPPVLPDSRPEQADRQKSTRMELETGCDYALEPPFVTEGTPDNRRLPKQQNLIFEVVTCIAPMSIAPNNMLYRCKGIPRGHSDVYTCVIDFTERMVRLVHSPSYKNPL